LLKGYKILFLPTALGYKSSASIITSCHYYYYTLSQLPLIKLTTTNQLHYYITHTHTHTHTCTEAEAARQVGRQVGQAVFQPQKTTTTTTTTKEPPILLASCLLRTATIFTAKAKKIIFKNLIKKKNPPK